MRFGRFGVRFILLLSMTLLAACTTPSQVDESFGSMRKVVEKLGSLREPPAMQLAEGFALDGRLKPVFFDALPWKGTPTKVFAWIGLPKGASQEKPVPGIVLVHGGGGTAFKEWVQEWNARGFAAISIAVEGQTDIKPVGDPVPEIHWQRHANGGPARKAIYGDSSSKLEDQWMYHAVADAILANSLLRSLPEVDAANVGIMGVSWGGVITSTVIGIDRRFAFAIPTYGCGGLHMAANQYGQALSQNETYKNVWDPNIRLKKATMPVLWFSWPGDDHFPMDCVEASRAKVSGISVGALVPEMQHGHEPAWERPESYAFAKSIVKNGKPWCVPVSTEIKEQHLIAFFETTQPLDLAMLFSSSDTGLTSERKWIQTTAALTHVGNKWVATALIPLGSTAFFLNVGSGNLVMSSRYLEH